LARVPGRLAVLMLSFGQSHPVQRDRTPGHNTGVAQVDESYRTARRVALAGIAVSGLLAFSNIVVGFLAHSTSVLATGFEFAGDVFASSIVLIGMGATARLADANH